MLTIGQLAREAGVGVETIRFYEREGLLAEPGRSSSGYRQYPPEAAERVKFLRRAQWLGFTLRDAQELLALRDNPDADRASVRAKATDKVADIDERIAQPQAMRAELARLLGTCAVSGRRPGARSSPPSARRPRAAGLGRKGRRPLGTGHDPGLWSGVYNHPRVAKGSVPDTPATTVFTIRRNA